LRYVKGDEKRKTKEPWELGGGKRGVKNLRWLRGGRKKDKNKAGRGKRIGKGLVNSEKKLFQSWGDRKDGARKEKKRNTLGKGILGNVKKRAIIRGQGNFFLGLQNRFWFTTVQDRE